MSQSGKSFRSILGVQPSSATVSDSIFIIIDAQNDYEFGALKIANLEKSRPNILKVLEKYRAVKGDVIHILHEAPPGAPIMTPGTPLADEFSELALIEGEKVVHKTKPSGFTGTNLQETIEAFRKKLVLAGYMAHQCVSATARAASESGYDVLLVGDAIGDRDIPGVAAADLVRVALAELEDVVATVIQSSDL